MKNLLIAISFAVALTSSANALETGKTDPNAAPAAQTPPAAETKAPECKPVTFTRPDVGTLKHFTLTFRDADIDAVKVCNPGAEIDKTANGVRIVITYTDQGAIVNMPTSMMVGKVHTGRCVNDGTGNAVDVVLYRATWNGTLPPKVDLAKVDKAFFDYSALLGTCQKLTDAKLFH